MPPLTMELFGLKELIDGGRYDVPSDRVAAALLKNITVLRVLRSAESDAGTTPPPGAQSEKPG